MARSPLLPVVRSALLLERQLNRLRTRTRAMRDAFLVEALSSTERDALGAALYSASPNNRTDSLFAWEETWFDRFLPAPGAGPVLAAGIGAGREVLALCERGHDVVAFEPSDAMAEEAEKRTGLSIHRATFADLITAWTTNAAFGGLSLKDTPFSAVLLGWGSLTHVVDDNEAASLLRVVDALCPNGPLLMSFLTANQRSRSSDRAAAVGRRVGTHVRKWRQLPPTSGTDAVILDPHVGFLRFWDPQKLHAIVPHRQLHFESSPYPHATLAPSLRN